MEIGPDKKANWANRKIWKAYIRGGLKSKRFDHYVNDHIMRKCKQDPCT